MQQLHRFSGPHSMRRSFGNASSSPGQSSGGQQTTPTPQPPPLQIVHQPAALFSSTQSRGSPNPNLRTTPSTSSRQPFNVNSIMMSAANQRINTETRTRAPHIRSIINGEFHASAPHIRPGGSEIRAPAPHMRPGGSEIRAPAPHMRPSGGSEIRAPAPRMRPSGCSEIRSPAPHIGPFRPASGSQDFATYRSQRVPLTPQVTSSLPLTYPTNFQALPSLSTSSPSLLQAPPQSTVAPPSLLAHNPALTSQQHPPSNLTATPFSHPHSSSQAALPRTPSLPTSQTGVVRTESGGPPLPSSDAANWHQHNSLQPLPEIGTMIEPLDLTSFMREASSSVHDLVCLSDDD